MIQTEPHHLRMGTRLNNRYLIQGVLGEGGFGITYVGMDEVLCQKVAVKEFFPRGAITRNNQQTNEVVSVYGTSPLPDGNSRLSFRIIPRRSKVHQLHFAFWQTHNIVRANIPVNHSILVNLI